jgi:hypothetical protein
MNDTSLPSSGWILVKQFGPSALAASLMYGGIYQIFEVLQYPLSNYVMEFANFIIRQSFPDRMPLPVLPLAPWTFQVRMVAIAIIVMAVGMFVGLWVQSRSQSEPSP